MLFLKIDGTFQGFFTPPHETPSPYGKCLNGQLKCHLTPLSRDDVRLTAGYRLVRQNLHRRLLLRDERQDVLGVRHDDVEQVGTIVSEHLPNRIP